MPSIKIKPAKFAGATQLYANGEGSLTDVIRKLAQDSFRERIVAVTDLTDNSTGTNTGNLVTLRGNLTPVGTLSGTNAAPKAGFDTAVGKAKNAISTLITQINLARVIAGLPVITDSSGGTSGNGTIAAMDKTTTAVNALCLDAPTALATLEAIKSALSRIHIWTNELCVAYGRAKLAGRVDGKTVSTNTGVLVVSAIGTSGTAVAGTVTGSTILNTEINTELTAIADDVSKLAATLNAMTGTASALPLQVIASE